MTCNAEPEAKRDKEGACQSDVRPASAIARHIPRYAATASRRAPSTGEVGDGAVDETRGETLAPEASGVSVDPLVALQATRVTAATIANPANRTHAVRRCLATQLQTATAAHLAGPSKTLVAPDRGQTPASRTTSPSLLSGDRPRSHFAVGTGLHQELTQKNYRGNPPFGLCRPRHDIAPAGGCLPRPDEDGPAHVTCRAARIGANRRVARDMDLRLRVNYSRQLVHACYVGTLGSIDDRCQRWEHEPSTRRPCGIWRM